MRSNTLYMRSVVSGALLFGGTLGAASSASAQGANWNLNTGLVSGYNNLLISNLSPSNYTINPAAGWTMRSLGESAPNPYYGNGDPRRNSALYTTRPGGLSTGLQGSSITSLSFNYQFDYSDPNAIGFTGGYYASPRASANFFGPVGGPFDLTPTRQLMMYFGSGAPGGLQSTGNLWDVNNTSVTWRYLSTNGESGYGWTTTDPGTKGAVLAELGNRALEGITIHLDGATGFATQTMHVSNWLLNGDVVGAPAWSVIPTPGAAVGAMALLGLTGLVRTRRRSA